MGTVFDHNCVHDMPHHALCVSWEGGNDCVFAYNVVSNCCNESDDAAAFYKGRNLFVRCGICAGADACTASPAVPSLTATTGLVQRESKRPAC